jgi:hypothetical protein
MKSTIRRFWPALVLALCCSVPNAFGQKVSFDIYGLGQSRDGIYISPYQATMTSSSGTSNVTVICDDFKDDSPVNTNLNGTLISFSSLSSNLGSTLWGSSKGLVAYEQAAWLVEGLLSLMSQPNPSTSTEAYYSFAIWAVMDPSDVLNWLKASQDWAACQAVFGNNCTGYSSTQLGKNSLLYQAQHQYGTGNYSNLALLVPTNMTGFGSCTKAGSCASQEFFVQVAEGGAAALYLLIAAGVCFGAIFLRSKRPNANQTA